MKTKYPIVLILLFLSNLFFAQKATDLTGLVTDSTGTGLLAATVVLMEKADSTLSAFAITEADGRFLVRKVAPGDYLLQVSFVGYETHWQPLQIPFGNDKNDLGQITLAPASATLDLVEVTADRVPLRMQGDTINYNAAAFRTQPGAVVEDLLKKLPGVEVQADGTIKAQGETVRNVFVDGKEFFGNDPQVATKNLPADAVDKVQVYDKKSKMAEFTGIEDGREAKTINLTLKEGHKNGYFGNATAGGGTDERYQSRFNLNRFSQKSQLSAIGMANNNNQAGFSFNDYMQYMGGLGSFIGAGGGGGGSRSVRMSFDLGQTGIPLEGGQIDGLLSTWAGGLNFNREFGKKTKLQSSYFVSKIRNDIERSTVRQNLLGDQSFRSTDLENTRSESINQRFNLSLEHQLDSASDLSLRSSLALGDANYNSTGTGQTFSSDGFLENENSRDYRSSGQRLDLTNSANYRRRFGKKGRALVLDASLNLGQNTQDGRLASQTSFLRNDEDNVQLNQRQQTTDDALSYGFGAYYTEPIGKGKYLEFSASRQNYANETGKDFYDIGPSGEAQNDQLSNHFKRGYLYDRTGLNLMVNRKKWNLTTGSALQRSSLEGQQRGESEALQRSFTRLLPSLFYNYEMGIGKNFSFEYRTELREPSTEQLQPLVDNSDPLNLYVGNPKLQPEYAHNISTQFMRFDQFTFTSFFANLEAEYVKDRITNASSVDSLFRRTVRPVNVKNDRSVRGYLDFSTPLRPLKTTVRLNLSSNWSRGILFVNDLENSTDRLTSGIDLSFSNRKKEHFDATIGARLSHNRTTYSESEALNQTYLNRRFYAEASVYPNQNWEFGSKFRYTVYSDENFGGEQVVPLWEASISRYLLKNKRGKLTLSAFDLLNKNLGIRRNSELNYIEEQRIRSLGRYVMLTFAYSIRGFGKQGGITIDLNTREVD
ncbi:MAG: TonB-dependent receptor family protein [Saprospiraceae bacterium]|nr:TonB-dependent receptor family protein [Saprospiraceae bacterium]